MDDKRIAELEEQLKDIQEELTRAKKEKADKEWPKEGDEYYFISNFCGVGRDKWGFYDGADVHRLKIGNVFQTEEDAKDRLDLLRWLAADPDRWEKIKIWREMVECEEGAETNGAGWIIWCSSDGHVIGTNYLGHFAGVSYRSKESAERCISKIGADRLKRYWFGVKE